MPRMDGTGPMGQGAMTGRGRGVCTDAKTGGYGCGMGRGFRRGMGICRTMQPKSYDLLKAEKETLQNRLAFVEKRLAEME